MVEAVLFAESSLTDERTGALFLDATRVAAKRDGESPPRELAHGDDGSEPALEVGGVVDLRHHEPRPSHAANGEHRQGPADPRAHDGPFVGRPWIGEQIRVARGVHGGAGVQDEVVVVAAVFRPRSRVGASWRGSPFRSPSMDNRISSLISMAGVYAS